MSAWCTIKPKNTLSDSLLTIGANNEINARHLQGSLCHESSFEALNRSVGVVFHAEHPLRSNCLSTRWQFFIFPSVVINRVVELVFNCLPPLTTVGGVIGYFLVWGGEATDALLSLRSDAS